MLWSVVQCNTLCFQFYGYGKIGNFWITDFHNYIEKIRFSVKKLITWKWNANIAIAFISIQTTPYQKYIYAIFWNSKVKSKICFHITNLHRQDDQVLKLQITKPSCPRISRPVIAVCLLRQPTFLHKPAKITR